MKTYSYSEFMENIRHVINEKANEGYFVSPYFNKMELKTMHFLKLEIPFVDEKRIPRDISADISEEEFVNHPKIATLFNRMKETTYETIEFILKKIVCGDAPDESLAAFNIPLTIYDNSPEGYVTVSNSTYVLSIDIEVEQGSPFKSGEHWEQWMVDLAKD